MAHTSVRDDTDSKPPNAASPAASKPPNAASPAARAWHEVGDDIRRQAASTHISTETALAVWMVEAGDLPFVQGRPVLRLECHKLWEHWGREEPSLFDNHFRFGGHAGVPGAAWTAQQFRSEDGEDWQSFHGTQDGEYAAFECAIRLAGLEAACLSSSFGGPQILGSNHGAVGYQSAASLFTAFSSSLSAQVKGFFDFCHSKNIVKALSDHRWIDFARVYNGPGQALAYADHINDAWLEARALLRGEERHASLTDKENFARDEFQAFFATLKLKHFSAREFLFRGQHHADANHPAHGLNRYPPPETWHNIAHTARALDAFRARAAAPMILTSIYRTPAYNEAIGGSPASEHMRFAAVDFEVRSEKPVERWISQLRTMRGEALFAGAIGRHGDAIHLDARGTNLDF